MCSRFCFRLPHQDCNVLYCIAQFLGRGDVLFEVGARINIVLTMDWANEIIATLDGMICEITWLICLKIDNCVILSRLGTSDSQLSLIDLCMRIFSTSAAHDVSITKPDIWALLASTSTLAAASTPAIFNPLRCPVDNLWLAMSVVRICEENILITLYLQIYLVNVLLAI